MVRIAVSGVCGRMGSQIVTWALDDRSLKVVGALEAPGHPALGQDLGQRLGRPPLQVIISDDPASALGEAHVLIEFTTPEATMAHARMAADQGVGMVIGTTGLSHAQHAGLQRLARRIPIFWSPNMSLGVLVVRRMLAAAAQTLKACTLATGTRLKILETHHVHKKDKPSGTAQLLQDDLATLLNRPPTKIPIASIREGEVVGKHEVIFQMADEQIRVVHDAQSRKIFAAGALIVAKTLARTLRGKPGYYTMESLWPSQRRIA